MCQYPTHKMQRNTVHISTVVFCAVVWLFPDNWKELTALIFMCPVDEALLSATNFTFMWPCIVTNFFIIKPTRCTNFPNLLWHEILHVSDSSFAHHQEFIHRTLSNGVCHTGWRQLLSRTILLLLKSCLQTCTTYTIAECTVNKLLMIGRGTARNI